MKEQTFSSSYPGSAQNENKTNQNDRQEIEHCCCPTRRRALSLDLLGNEVGCITGFRNKKTIRIVALRGNVASPTSSSSVRLGRSPWCPFHRNENVNNVTMEGIEKTYKEVIMIWNESAEHAKRENWDDAYNALLEIMNYSAKMRFNLGQIAWALQNPGLAKENFLVAIEKDPHMALAHFQLGMVNYRLHRYNESRGSYDKAKTCLRGNKFIDYRQLGFVHKLYECEVLYNLALTYATMMNNSEYGLELLEEASKVAIESRHAPMIEKAQKQLMRNELYEPYVLPGNQLFRPPKSKVDNLKRVDYLGKHKVVSELPESRNNNNKDDFKLPGKPGDRNTFRPINDDFSSDEDSLSPNSSSPTPSMVAKMTHKDTLAIWHEGVKAFDKGDLSGALDQLNGIVDPSAKILYNIGILQKALGQLDDALSTFKGVVASDPYLAIGHFQLGVVYGQLQQCNEAWEAFGKTQEVLRGNKMIDYKQLGLQYKLHKCEVLHNEAWTHNEQNSRDWTQKLLDEALACKADARHDKIDESKRNFSNGYSFQLFEPSKPLLFRPPKSKIDNLERKDYLGKAKIVAKLPSHRGGSSTPPPTSNTRTSLGISVLPPRSKTPTPASSGQKAPPPSKPPPVNGTSSSPGPALPTRPAPLQTSISSLAAWKTPTVTVDAAGPALPRRPPPSKSPSFDLAPPGHDAPDGSSSPTPGGRLSPVPTRPLPQRIDGQRSPPPNRPLPSLNRTSPIPTRPVPSPNRTSPIPTRPVPQKPIPSGPGDPYSGRKLSVDVPPGRSLPSPNRTSPIPDRPLPQRPRDNADAPPARQLPSPKRFSPLPDRSSPLPDRPLPAPPGKAMSSDLPDRALPQPPKSRVSDLPNRPLPGFPTSDSGDLAQRPVPPRPAAGVRDLPGKAFPPPLVTRESDVPSRSLPPAPKTDSRNDSNDSPPDLPSRPPPMKSKISSMSSGVGKEETDSPNDLPSRPIPPVPRTSSSSPTFLSTPASPPAPPSPKLPARPFSVPASRTASNSSSSSSTASEDLPFRPVPALPASATNDEPQLPPRPTPAAPKLPERPSLSGSASPSLPDKPLPRPPGGVNNERRASSPGLPDLPPPPPPPSISKARSPVVPRRQIPSQEVSGGGGDKKAPGHKAKLVKIITDSPPVLRKAAAVTVVQKEKSPAIPTRPGNGVSNGKPTLPAKNKPAPAGNKPLPAGNKPTPVANKPAPAASKPPPIHAFKPQPKPNGGAGKKRTALVIAAHEASGDGEVSVSEGDLISITGEDGDWLEVEVKGEKGRLPKTCVKSFSKPGIQVNFQ